jgi:hypothetical protein
MTLHFAYGSNMSRELMRPRCRGAVELGPAVLPGHRFFISDDGYASVEPAAGHAVHGLLWRLTPRDRVRLDAYESLDTGLYAARWLVVAQGPRRLKTLVYVGRSRTAGRPKPGYLDLVLAAAREVDLSPAYVRSLARWAHASGSRLSRQRPETWLPRAAERERLQKERGSFEDERGMAA